LFDRREIGLDAEPRLIAERADQGYVFVGNHKEFPVSAKIGRQELVYGEQRQVGSFLWNNNARSFDAAKVRYQSKWFGADVFTGGVVFNDSNNFDKSHLDSDHFSGVYVNFTKIPGVTDKQLVETYLYNHNVDRNSLREDWGGVAAPFRQPFVQDLYTAGLRIKSKPNAYGAWDYSAELMYQFGTIYNRFTRDMTEERDAIVLRGALYLIFALALMIVSLVADFAKVRAVVEDRHSMIGALGASLRFLRRRFVRAAALYALNVLALLVILRLWLQVAPSAATAPWLALLIGQIYLLMRVWAKLAFMASETVYFQGELAHADYTAAPDPVWPDSPAVEALGNLRRS